ncbi:hypothetical protein PV350_46835, partial [Streptomyces sp. PA03-6a]|nr:hypothetical protein [Streptomyces sp. PA03-6a]
MPAVAEPVAPASTEAPVPVAGRTHGGASGPSTGNVIPAPANAVGAESATEWDTAMSISPAAQPPAPALVLEREPITMIPAAAVTATVAAAAPPVPVVEPQEPPGPAIFGAPLPVQPPRQESTAALVRGLRSEMLEAHREVLDAQRALRDQLAALLSAP